ncbi:phytanoyl-CoA hydroxylase-interacting protein-like [Haliotis rubra]|uniref:phytanoyl-CoA hydroxylase-interacting protein-like n=1 Tax=Haliotis rubra TaxID=36100 RepID=UPI001EE50157|nr:phytanoyl-CoA hydroxylase-interacting protein-like [Haliotis rubra]
MAEAPSFKLEYVKKLFRRAEEHCNNLNTRDQVFTLYRNKPSSYFEDIKRKHDNIMKPYLKDHGGDPRCPINRTLEGLFFGVTLWEGKLPTKSPYGDTRMLVPLEGLFDDSARLYFADFYCMRGQRKNHYVTLVITEQGTAADNFCENHLVKLDIRKNTFLMMEGAYAWTPRQDKVWVEVFYTNEVNIFGLRLTKTEVIGKGSSTGGIPKSSDCNICNVELSDKELSRTKTLQQIDVFQLQKELLMLKLQNMRQATSDEWYKSHVCT